MKHIRKRCSLFVLLLCAGIMMGLFGQSGKNVLAAESESVSSLSAGIRSDLSVYPAGVSWSSKETDLTAIQSTGIASSSTSSSTAVSSYVSGSELDAPQKWTLQFSGKTLNASFQDTTVDSTCLWGIQIYTYGGTSSDDLVVSQYTTIGNGSLSFSVASLDEGRYQMYLLRGDTPSDTSADALVQYTIRVTSAKAVFCSVYYADGVAAAKEIAANADPTRYRKVAELYYTDTFTGSSRLTKIIKKAKSLTKGVSGDEEKLRKIHDWICSSISYDYDAASVGYVETQKQNNPFWVYKNRRGVCGGYARLMEIMLTSVGVPCLYIEGHADDGSGDSADESTNHAWNMVYIGGNWIYLDVTWDCGNRYYSGTAVTGHTLYANYGPSLFSFSKDHLAQKYGKSHYYVTKISLETKPKRNYTKGTSLSVTNGVLLVTRSDGSTSRISLKASMCSGYRKNTYGQQKIQVSYAGAVTYYTVNVLPQKGSTATVDGIRYRITKASASKGTVSVVEAPNTKKVVIPQKVRIHGFDYKVTGIASDAFRKCTKLKKLSLETPYLKKKQIGSSALSGLRRSAKIYVPAAKYASYRKLLKNKGQGNGVSIRKAKTAS